MNFRKLEARDIECRVKQTTAKGNIVLLYKTARTDMDILDETVGAENWYKTYREIKGNLYCTLFIRCGQEWVGKEDCGIESRADDDGNEKKGEASDAFKRAGFAWGIGRELYTAPFCLIPCEVESSNGRYKPKTNHYYEVSEIQYDGNRISKLVITERGKAVFTFPASYVPKDDDILKQTDPDARKEEIKAEILALAKGDEDRLNNYTLKKYKKLFRDLTGQELADCKVSLVKQVS